MEDVSWRKNQKKVNGAASDCGVPLSGSKAAQNDNGEQERNPGHDEGSDQEIAGEVGKGADAPRIKWIEPRFEFIGGAVTELGDSQKVGRVPLVPDFQPQPAEWNVFFFKCLIARGTKRQ